MTEKIRVFIAVEVPAKVARSLADLRYRIEPPVKGIKWVAAVNIHLTLRFLGNISAKMLEPLADAMMQTAGSQMAFGLEARGLGVFPNLKRPRVIWAGLEGQIQELEKIARKLEMHLESLGFRREKRGFRAHLTLGRFKPRAKIPAELSSVLRQAASFDPLPFTVDRLVLFSSVLQPSGPIYRSIASADFNTNRSRRVKNDSIRQ